LSSGKLSSTGTIPVILVADDSSEIRDLLANMERAE
jgi:hypothetical protein